MTLDQIKAALDAGEKVHWQNRGYNVIKDKIGQYLVVCPSTGGCWGLTHRDGVTMNGKPEEFYIERQDGAAGLIIEYERGLLKVFHVEGKKLLWSRPSSGKEWSERLIPMLRGEP